MNRHYPAVARRAGHRCEYCRAPEALFNLPFEVDHVVPVSQGGAGDETNLALTCRSCNLHKSDCLAATDPVAGQVVPLFHPRAHRWGEHFAADLDRGEIQGLTPTGRATVEQLRFNDPTQVVARQLWIALRLFP
jgi:hypothetical protein